MKKRKLKLRLEQLEVESFDTRDAARRRGTVLGHDDVTQWYCSVEGTGCQTDDGCCGAATYGGACDTSGECDDISACWGGLC